MFVIDHPVIGKLEVANQDFANKMTLNHAKKTCEDLGDGWRLPTATELKLMYEQLFNEE